MRSSALWLLLCQAAAAPAALASSTALIDANGDGHLNVLDVARAKGLAGEATQRGLGSERIVFDPADATAAPGGPAEVLVLLEGSSVPLFGYSLDIVVTPLEGATGALTFDPSATGFFDERNLITAAGLTRDPVFSLIESDPDGGFVTTNADDLSTTTATPGVNDALAQLVFTASPDASGAFEISLGPGSALSDGAGFAVPFEETTATVTVEAAVGGVGFENEPNSTFETRETVQADPDCFYLNGKLQTNRVQGRYPDTYLFMFDKQDNVVCEDDDSSTKGNGKASACFGVAPIPGDPEDPSAGATVRLGVTGRPDGVDTMFNGLFFNAPHGQLGEADVCVSYFDDAGAPLGQDVYRVAFTTGAEAYRVNFQVPNGTASVDVELDNTVERIEICNDVDYFQLEGLDPFQDYCVTVVGGVNDACEPTDTTLSWWNKNGRLVYPVGAGGGPDDGGRYSQLCVIADAHGRIRLAISGQGDNDFDGLLDAQSMTGALTTLRDAGTGPLEPPNGHGVCGCYTLKFEPVPHDAATPGGGETEQTMARLGEGDLNLDGGVDVIDLAIMLNNWGQVTP